METAASRRQILVADFDSVHQADTWRRHGAEEATRRLVSVLRTAILVGDELTIDRNQLFDGIFFLALGPDGIAAALGLSASAKLPITVTCQGGIAADDDRVVPVHRARFGPDSSCVSIDLQLNHVRSEGFRQASSALMAAWGDGAANGWLCGPPGPDWRLGAGLTRYDTIERDWPTAVRLVEEAQDRWAMAMEDGRVAVDRWDRAGASGVLDVSAALEETRLTIGSRGAVLRPLGAYVLAHENATRKEVAADVHAWVQQNHADTDFAEARMAMEMWSRAYYRAMAERDARLYLSFFDTVDDSELADSYGLTLPPRSRRQRVWDRLWGPSDGGASGTKRTLRVEGSIMDEMRVIAPAHFSQLYLSTRDTARKLIAQHDSQAMYDLAYAAREAVNEPPSHAEKRAATIRRMVLGTVVAVVLTVLSLLVDLGDMSRGLQAGLIVVAAIIGTIVGLPWSDIREFLSLRKSSMTATLTLAEEEQ